MFEQQAHAGALRLEMREVAAQHVPRPHRAFEIDARWFARYRSRQSLLDVGRDPRPEDRPRGVQAVCAQTGDPLPAREVEQCLPLVSRHRGREQVDVVEPDQPVVPLVMRQAVEAVRPESVYEVVLEVPMFVPPR